MEGFIGMGELSNECGPRDDGVGGAWGCGEDVERVVDGAAFCIQEEEGVDVSKGRMIGCYDLGVDLCRVFYVVHFCGVVQDVL